MSITLEEIEKAMKSIKNETLQKPFKSPFDFCGLKIIESPSYPAIQLSDDFEYISDEGRNSINEWLIETFGYKNTVPRDTAFIMYDAVIIHPDNRNIIAAMIV